MYSVERVLLQVQADRSLYFLLFGEALLNDGVTFVLFEGASLSRCASSSFSIFNIFEGFKELALVPENLNVPW